MKKFCCLGLLFLLFGVAQQVRAAEEQWVVLPAGAKPAYMGIHGGTMPVSLLVADDGEALLTFVGRTGNDFLEALRQAHSPMEQTDQADVAWGSLGSSLFAGNATASLPVIAISGDKLGQLSRQLQPFGLSSEPVSIEGQVAKPEIFPTPPLRSFSLTDWLFPGRKRK